MTIFGDTLKANPELAWAVGMTVTQPEPAPAEAPAAGEAPAKATTAKRTRKAPGGAQS